MKTSNHHQSNQNGSSHHNAVTVASVATNGGTGAKASVDPPPTPGVPSPPPGFVPTRSGRGSAVNLQHVQIDVGSGMASDLLAVPAGTFGNNAPDLDTASAGIVVAVAWSTERLRALEYAAYARDREVAAWTPVLATLEPLGRMFDLAVERDPKLAEALPSLTQFYEARKAAGVKAAKSRKAKKAADAAKAASQPAPSPAPQPVTPVVTDK